MHANYGPSPPPLNRTRFEREAGAAPFREMIVVSSFASAGALVVMQQGINGKLCVVRPHFRLNFVHCRVLTASLPPSLHHDPIDDLHTVGDTVLPVSRDLCYSRCGDRWADNEVVPVRPLARARLRCRRQKV